MESERKMKLTNLTKSVLAASALTVASFSANATVISSSILEVSGFGLAIEGGTASVPVSTWTLKNDATFNGTTENQQSVNVLTAVDAGNPFLGEYGDPAMVCAGSCPISIGENNFDQDLLNLGDSLDFSSADSYLFTNPAISGTDAQTRADVSVTSLAGGALHTAGSEIQNSINTSVAFTISGDASSTITLFYAYTAQLVTEISNDWLNPTHNTTADASYGLSFRLTRDGNDLFVDGATGVDNYIALSQFGVDGNSNANNEAGTREEFASVGPKSLTLTNLVSGDYKLVINHSTSASASHVPEPTTLAILGLGLLGFAGTAKRRKS